MFSSLQLSSGEYKQKFSKDLSWEVKVDQKLSTQSSNPKKLTDGSTELRLPCRCVGTSEKAVLLLLSCRTQATRLVKVAEQHFHLRWESEGRDPRATTTQAWFAKEGKSREEKGKLSLLFRVARPYIEPSGSRYRTLRWRRACSVKRPEIPEIGDAASDEPQTPERNFNEAPGLHKMSFFESNNENVVQLRQL